MLYSMWPCTIHLLYASVCVCVCMYVCVCVRVCVCVDERQAQTDGKGEDYSVA